MAQDVTPAAPPTKKKGGCLRNAIIGVVVLVVVLGGLAWFGMQMQNRANNLLASAQENRDSGNYEAALNDLEQVIEEYSSLDQAEEAQELVPVVQLEWAAALRDDGEFAESLERYDQVQNAVFADEVVSGKLETRLGWGEALVEEGEYTDALEQIDIVREQVVTDTLQTERISTTLVLAYAGLAGDALETGNVAEAYEHVQTALGIDPQSAEARAVVVEMAQPLYEQAQQAMGGGQFADAETMLLLVVQYAPESETAAQIQQELPGFYIAWGQALMEAALYAEAAVVYQYLIETYPESEVTAQARVALVDAEVAAVKASGQAGALPDPLSSGSTGAGPALYSATNDTECPITILLSGPQSQSLQLPSFETREVEIEPGSYGVVVKIDETQELRDNCRNIIPFTGDYALESGGLYNSSFYIEVEEEN